MSSISATEDQKSFGQLIACERNELRDRLRQASASAQARAKDLSEAELDELLDEARSDPRGAS